MKRLLLIGFAIPGVGGTAIAARGARTAVDKDRSQGELTLRSQYG